jgi:hypothetical protein
VIAYAIGLLVVSLGAILAGRGYIRTAKRMRSYATVRGRVIARDLAVIGGDTREGRWGKGGGYWPRATYVFTVDGVEHRSDKTSYAHRGLRRSLAEAALAAIPDEVDVHYDPRDPEQAYLDTHTPRMGYWFLGGGVVGALFALLLLLGSL